MQAHHTAAGAVCPPPFRKRSNVRRAPFPPAPADAAFLSNQCTSSSADAATAKAGNSPKSASPRKFLGSLLGSLSFLRKSFAASYNCCFGNSGNSGGPVGSFGFSRFSRFSLFQSFGPDRLENYSQITIYSASRPWSLDRLSLVTKPRPGRPHYPDW